MGLDRRRFLLGLGPLLAAPLALAEEGEHIPLVTILTFGSPANNRSRTDAFVKGMRDLGFVDARNVHYQIVTANGQQEVLDQLARELAAAKPDVILSASTRTTEALVKAKVGTPIVMASVEDPVASGFVRSLARPESNVTGLMTHSAEDVPVLLQLLALAVPKMTKVAALLNPANPTYASYRARLDAASHASQLRTVVVDAKAPSELEAAFRRIAGESAHGLMVMADNMLYTDRASVVELATRHRVPAIYPNPGYVEAGGLMSYGPNPDATFLRAASYVARILKGAKPAEIPVAQPPPDQLTINRATARTLDLALPPDLLKRAARVIG